MGWNVGDYQLHYYGPYSQNLAAVLQTSKTELIEETKPEFGPYLYSLTKFGEQFISDFVANVCNEEKTKSTISLFQELSNWSKDELELASTLDYVSKNTPGIPQKELLNKVSIIKHNFARSTIENVYGKWQKWKNIHNF